MISKRETNLEATLKKIIMVNVQGNEAEGLHSVLQGTGVLVGVVFGGEHDGNEPEIREDEVEQ